VLSLEETISMMFEEFVAFIGSQDGAPPKPIAPDAAPPSAIIGEGVPRIDGPLKTTGSARYASDYNFPGLVYAVPVRATIASGKILHIDSTAAEAMPGVCLVMHHGNIMPLYRNASGGRNSENRPAFEDENVYYWGQYVAAVVAETFEQAQAAAAAVRVEYEPTKFNVDTSLSDTLPAEGQPHGPQIMSQRGDTEAAFASAAVKVDEVYMTPVETHNPMEMHATVAVWDGKKYTLYESSQGVMNHQNVMAQVLGEPRENVEVISRFMGSGFGGKLFPWPHSAIAAAAARRLKRPVKITLSRKMMFSNSGHRPNTQQRIRLGATPDGKLVSLQQDYRNHTSYIDDVRENCGEATPFLYSTQNLKVTSALVRRNVGTPAPMRGPGAVPGLFALESAIDELAIKLKMDPVQLRLSLDTLVDEEKNKPFSSRHLKECLQVGAEKFGWARRTPEVGSMRKGNLILGWGVAAASWGANRGVCEASVNLWSDGKARVSCGTQDIGTGSYTVIAQIITDKTGIPVRDVEVVLGSSSLPPGPTSGGSTATSTFVPAVIDAVNAAVKVVLTVASTSKGSPFEGKEAKSLALTSGRVHEKGQSAESGVPYGQIIRMANLASANGDGKSGGLAADPKSHNYSTHSFGTQFVEVEWDPGIAHLRVSRVVSVVDGGRIINKRTATNQMAGAIVMGVGMGLFEETIYDPRNGHPVNDNFADYIVPTIADMPQIDVHFLDIPDFVLNEYGTRGIGEIGLAGVAPAITAAVYHATGVRLRRVPVKVEDLLQARKTA
jgi:xanthine dehydrogenase YagR molybdenum-binding subunit